MDYTDYIDLDTNGRTETTPNRNAISQGIEQYVTQHYDAEPSRINRNAWRLRFDMDVETADQLNDIITTINTLVRDTPTDYHLTWQVITTDGRGQKNGFTNIGRWGEDRDQLTERQYPIEALDVSVDNW